MLLETKMRYNHAAIYELQLWQYAASGRKCSLDKEATAEKRNLLFFLSVYGSPASA